MSLLLLFLCAITIQAALPKDTAVLNLVVETSTLAVNRIDNSISSVFYVHIHTNSYACMVLNKKVCLNC